jgi:hypothetical protein
VVLPIELLPQRRAPTPRIPIDGCFLLWQIEAIGDAGICPLDILDLDTTCGGLMVALLQPFSRGEIVLSGRDDQQSVVDPDCGVIGVEALRLPMLRSCRAFLVRRRT